MKSLILRALLIVFLMNSNALPGCKDHFDSPPTDRGTSCDIIDNSFTKTSTWHVYWTGFDINVAVSDTGACCTNRGDLLS